MIHKSLSMIRHKSAASVTNTAPVGKLPNKPKPSSDFVAKSRAMDVPAAPAAAPADVQVSVIVPKNTDETTTSSWKSIWRWFLIPVVFAACQWLLYTSPAQVQAWTPTLWVGGPSFLAWLSFWPWSFIGTDSAAKDVLPELQSHVQSFDLAYEMRSFIALGCNETDRLANTSACALILENAGKLVLHDGPLTKTELLDSRQLAIEADAVEGWINSVWHTFNWATLLWLVGTCGLVCTFIPCILACWDIFKDLFRSLAELAGAVWAILYDNIISYAHQYGFLEALAYIFVFVICVDATRYPPENSVAAERVGLLGGLLFIPCFFYSGYLFAPETTSDSKLVFLIMYSLSAAVLIPLTLSLVSPLIGFFAAGAVVASVAWLLYELGKFVPCQSLFSSCAACAETLRLSPSSMYANSLVSAVIVLSAFSPLATFASEPVRSLTAPFAFGVLFWAQYFCLYGVLLLYSSGESIGGPYFVIWNVVNLVLLAGTAALGLWLSLWTLVSGPTGFLLLWFWQKIWLAELPQQLKTILTFLNFALFVWAAHFFTTDPFGVMFVASIYDTQNLYYSDISSEAA